MLRFASHARANLRTAGAAGARVALLRPRALFALAHTSTTRRALFAAPWSPSSSPLTLFRTFSTSAPPPPPPPPPPASTIDDASALKVGIAIFAAGMLGAASIYAYTTSGSEAAAPAGGEDGVVAVDSEDKSWFSLSAWQTWYANLNDPPKKPLLPDAMPDQLNRPIRTLVLELDDVLIHTHWDRESGWRFKFRPGMHWFLYRLAQSGYELVLWSSHPQYIGEALAVATEKNIVAFSHKLYKEASTHTVGETVKDLSRLNRDLARVLVLDTAAHKFSGAHADNVVRVAAFKGDARDDALFQLLPFIEQLAKDDVTDVREVLRAYRAAATPIPQEFHRRQLAAKQASGGDAAKKPTITFGSNKKTAFA